MSGCRAYRTGSERGALLAIVCDDEPDLALDQETTEWLEQRARAGVYVALEEGAHEGEEVHMGMDDDFDISKGMGSVRHDGSFDPHVSAATRAKWKAAADAERVKQADRQLEREHAEMRGEEFMKEAADLRHRHTYGEIDTATAERLYQALETKFPLPPGL
jgi:hypothetical protein